MMEHLTREMEGTVEHSKMSCDVHVEYKNVVFGELVVRNMIYSERSSGD